jgi:hypothetical protein
MLTQAGMLQNPTIEDELQTIYSGSSGYELYVFNVPIGGVAGIWEHSDITHSGSNYYDTTSGSLFTESNGQVVLASGASVISGEKVRITYRFQAGLTDSQVLMELESAKQEVNHEFDMTWTYDLTTSDTVEQLAILLVYAIAVKYAILALNSSNAIQGGSSFNLGELGIQTKLWGEGMSMGELFRMYEEKIRDLKNILKLAYDSAPVVIIDRSAGSLPYYKRAFPLSTNRVTMNNAAIFVDSGKIYVTADQTIYEGWVSGMGLIDG